MTRECDLEKNRKMKHLASKTPNDIYLKEGDYAYLQVEPTGGKFRNRFTGPYITDKLPSSHTAILREWVNSAIRHIVHRDRLNLACSLEPTPSFFSVSTSVKQNVQIIGESAENAYWVPASAVNILRPKKQYQLCVVNGCTYQYWFVLSSKRVYIRCQFELVNGWSVICLDINVEISNLYYHVRDNMCCIVIAMTKWMVSVFCRVVWQCKANEGCCHSEKVIKISISIYVLNIAWFEQTNDCLLQMSVVEIAKLRSFIQKLCLDCLFDCNFIKACFIPNGLYLKNFISYVGSWVSRWFQF